MPRLSGAISALVFVTAACSSSPPLPAAEYFFAIEAELSRLDQATKDLTARFATELESELDLLLSAAESSEGEPPSAVIEQIVATTKAKMQSIIEAHTEQLDVFADRVGQLAPPRAVASGHDELVAAFAAWAATGEDTVAQLGQTAALEEIASAITATPYADAQLRVDQSCRALLDNAAAVDVTLTCPGTQLDIIGVAP